MHHLTYKSRNRTHNSETQPARHSQIEVGIPERREGGGRDGIGVDEGQERPEFREAEGKGGGGGEDGEEVQG